MLFTKKRPLRVGTDCSGIEAPIVALRQLKVPFVHEFSSEIDKHCIASIRANYDPKIIFGDMRQRKLKDIPDIDLYVCGFPCQPFSVAGNREGVRDPRGTIFWECVRVIRYKRPMIFILENVRGLLSIDGGKTFEAMIQELKKIPGYHVEWKVLNTKDYGIPQNRSRVFIVGLLKKHQQNEWKWPTPFSLTKNNIQRYIHQANTTKSVPSAVLQKSLRYLDSDIVFINIGFLSGKRTLSKYLCPTLCADSKLWCMPMMRYADIFEYLKIQGFPATFTRVVSESRLKKQIGNSMSTNVLYFLFKNTFQSME